MKKLIIDLDGTLTTGCAKDYLLAEPNIPVIEQLIEYKKEGFDIVISTSRNMRTYKGNIGKINKNTLPVIIEWLDRHNIPYDEVYIGKPWCGNSGFYIDDKAIRPSEFCSMNYDEIMELLKLELK